MKTCLVVEDSETVRHILASLIEASGCHVLLAANASEGLDILSAARPDIVFLDWDLPKLEALDFLKEFGRQEEGLRAHVVLCAMENDAQQFALARAAGARFNIIKPYDKRDITDILGVIEQVDETAAQERVVA